METSTNVIKNRFTPEQIREFIQQWQLSGLNRRQFCEQRGFNYYTFGTWWEKYNKTQPASGGFAEVKLSASTAVFARLTFSNGSHVDFFQPVSAEYFQNLLK